MLKKKMRALCLLATLRNVVKKAGAINDPAARSLVLAQLNAALSVVTPD